jgi:hypothetical protein
MKAIKHIFNLSLCINVLDLKSLEGLVHKLQIILLDIFI